MGRSISKDDPSQADHRFIGYILKSFFDDKNVTPDPKEYDRIGDVFEKMGGSWERLFKGSSRDMLLIKRIVKVSLHEKYLKKQPDFR
jgi:hypothetical protein